MKHLITVVFLLLTSQKLISQSTQMFTDLLDKYVSDEGKVDYKGFINEKEKFQEFLDFLSANKPTNSLSTNEKLAYWINTYNAFTIKLIIDNYPVQSITDLHPLIYIPGFNTVWHEEFFKIGDEDFSLDRIEHKILRKEFNEARIHFAINCASVSCPNLRNEAFKAHKLDDQLTEQTRVFLNDVTKNSLEKNEIQISKIFSWFKGDFEKEGGLIKFINKYSNTVISKDAKISYKSYDWSLNE